MIVWIGKSVTALFISQYMKEKKDISRDLETKELLLVLNGEGVLFRKDRVIAVNRNDEFLKLVNLLSVTKSMLEIGYR